MSELPNSIPEPGRELMSDLADGRANGAQAARQWAGDAQAREAWHVYHLIGDVLRSEDLASPAGHDAEFLAALRLRLAEEPPIVAPAPAAPAAAVMVRRRWVAPAAVAASFATVAAVVLLSRTLAPASEGNAVLAAAPAASRAMAPQASGLVAVTPAPLAGEPSLQVVDGNLIRDARLDSYFRAHRGGSAAVPGSAIGRFETVVLER